MSDEQVVAGFHAIRSILKSDAARVSQLLVQRQRRDKRVKDLLAIAEQSGVAVQWVDQQVLDDRLPDGRHQGVIALYQGQPPRQEDELWQQLAESEAPWLILVLDEVQDPHNLGACLRTAEAAGVSAVITPADNAVGLTDIVRRTAAGAADRVPIYRVVNLQRSLKRLQQEGVWVYGAAGEAEKMMYSMDWRGSVAIVMGAEGKGMRRLTREVCDELFQIPMAGHIESLNVSVATGVALFEVVRQRQA